MSAVPWASIDGAAERVLLVGEVGGDDFEHPRGRPRATSGPIPSPGRVTIVGNVLSLSQVEAITRASSARRRTPSLRKAPRPKTLEPMMKRALEGAGFISAYDRSAIGRTLGVRPPETLDETSARELAVKQGLGIVLSGSVDKRGTGYAIAVKASETVSGREIANVRGRASSKDEVMGAATRLVAARPQGTGRRSSESNAAVRHGQSCRRRRSTSCACTRQPRTRRVNGKFEEARDHALKAVRARSEIRHRLSAGGRRVAQPRQAAGRAEVHRRSPPSSRRDDRTRAVSRHAALVPSISGDYQQCVKEYSELHRPVAADVVGHNQVALCSSQLRDLRRRGRDEAGREAAAQAAALPRQPDAVRELRERLHDRGEEARQVEGPDAYAMLALAFSQLGQGDLTRAKKTYEELAAMSGMGASLAASGLGDLASVEGRFSEAVRIFARGLRPM